MYENKKVLLIAGGGTLGTYTADELLKKGCLVDIICPEDKVSSDSRLSYYKAFSSVEYLMDLFSKNHYDAIVDFVYYKNPDDYIAFYEVLSANTDQLVYISSYRVYADSKAPLTEASPLLSPETVKDKDFLENEDYALSKIKNEEYIKKNSSFKNWTIVRPVISFSKYRMDVIAHSGTYIIDCAKEGKTIPVPIGAKDKIAGLDWAGNTGKIIANLLFKKGALGEIFTVSSAPNLTWGEVADIYKDLIGAKFEWIDTEEYIKIEPKLQSNPWLLTYDRLFDRRIDNSKVLNVTGLSKKDFATIRDGIKTELKNFE